MTTISTTGIDATKPVGSPAKAASIRSNIAEIIVQLNNAGVDIDTKAASGSNSNITELTGLTTDLTIAQGGTGQGTAQAAINALSAVSGATNEYVLTKDTVSGNAIFKINPSPSIALTESFTSVEQTITSAGSLTIAHGLATTPNVIWATLICKTAELNYSVGDKRVLSIGIYYDGANSRGVDVDSDATNLNIRFASATNPIRVGNKTTGVSTAITSANWKVIFGAYA